MASTHHKSSVSAHGSTRSYSIGFALSLLLTFIAYAFVAKHTSSNHIELSHHLLIGIIMSMAVVQLFVQLIFFLHVGRESKPRWNLIMLLLAGTIVVIVVAGTLWVMSNLNYRMTPSEINTYINSQDSL